MFYKAVLSHPLYIMTQPARGGTVVISIMCFSEKIFVKGRIHTYIKPHMYVYTHIYVGQLTVKM